MRGDFKVKFTIGGHPFYVRRDRVTSISEMPQYEQEDINPTNGQPYKAGEMDYRTEEYRAVDAEPRIITALAVDGQGSVAIDESLPDALEAWEAM